MASTPDPLAEEPSEGSHEGPLKDVFCPPTRSVDAALLFMFTNSGYGLPVKSENVPANHDFEATIPSTESAINADHFSNTGLDAGTSLTTAEQNNHPNDSITATEMPLPTASFKPDTTSSALQSNNKDPTLFTLEDLEKISCAGDPSSSAIATNGMDALGSPCQPLEMHSQWQDSCQLYTPSSGDPSMPTPAHFSIVMNPSIADLHTGRRRSQSVPPQMPTFARRLENGQIRQIGIPSTRSGRTPNHHNTRPHHPNIAQPDIADSSYDRLVSRPSQATHTHIQPSVSNQTGLLSCKRPFHQHCDQASDSDRMRPEPKRRNQRMKTLSSLACGAMSALQLEPILENLRVMLQSRFEEVKNGRFEELEV